MKTNIARPRRLGSWLAAALAGLLAAACSVGPGQPRPTPTSPYPHVTLSALEADVEVRANVGEEFAPASEGQLVPLGGQVRTGESARALLEIGQDANVRLGSGTLITLDGLDRQGEQLAARLRLPRGRLWIRLHGGRLTAVTPLGAVSVEGSFADVQYTGGANDATTQDDSLLIRCLEGSCTFANTVHLGSLEQLVITAGGLAISGPAPLPASAIDDFLRENPESVDLAPTLTAVAHGGAAGTPSATPTGTVGPGLPASRWPSATRMSMPLGPLATFSPPTSTPTRAAVQPVVAPSATSTVEPPIQEPPSQEPPLVVLPTAAPPTAAPTEPPPSAAPTEPPPTATELLPVPTLPLPTPLPPTATSQPEPTHEPKPTKPPRP